MITPADVIAEARSWIGTPFLHQGRSRNGIDCVGLVIVAMQNLGGLPEGFEAPEYGRLPNRGLLEQRIAEHCASLDAPCPGSLISVRWQKDPAHVAIYTGESIVHAYQKRGGVVEHSFRGKWLSRIAGVWALPGVMYE